MQLDRKKNYRETLVDGIQIPICPLAEDKRHEFDLSGFQPP